MLALALATSYGAASPDDPAEVQRIRTIAERALALAPDDATVLDHVGLALCFVGYPEEGERHTERAVHKAPGHGLAHSAHGQACLMLNRPEEAFSHLSMTERLRPGAHVMWVVKLRQAQALRELGRWAPAEAAIDASIALYPTSGRAHVEKALICVRLGRDVEARKHIETARRMGLELALVERGWRRAFPNSPRLEADIATIRALYAATEPGA
jgi:Flp pilus assembly protein TadD